MTPPPRNDAHTKKVSADDEAPEESPRPDRTSSIEHSVSDDAAGDEGIDEPAADD
jgi:hypothetical protein